MLTEVAPLQVRRAEFVPFIFFLRALRVLGPAVGVGVGVPLAVGAWIAVVMGEPVLKKPTVPLALCGGWAASNRKLYSVPQRIAFAFWFCAKVSQFHMAEFGKGGGGFKVKVQGVLL